MGSVSGGSQAAHWPDSVSLGNSKGIRPYRRREKAVILLAGMLMAAFSLGTDLSSGILYAKLLDPPCSTNASEANATVATLPPSWGSPLNTTNEVASPGFDDGDRQSNATMTTSENPKSTTATETDEISNGADDAESCGGFGRTSSETGRDSFVAIQENG